MVHGCPVSGDGVPVHEMKFVHSESGRIRSILQPCEFFSVQGCIELRLRRIWLRITEVHGSINKVDSFVNGLDIHEYHYSFKDKFRFEISAMKKIGPTLRRSGRELNSW